jgi:GGDEF domain-containing protein
MAPSLAVALREVRPRPVAPAATRTLVDRARAAEDRELHERFDRLTPAQRAHEFFYDPNTGAGNEAAFKVFSQAPSQASPLFAQFSVDGVKWVNDTYGHDAGQVMYRVVAEALHDAVPDLCKVRGDFGGRAVSAEDADRIARLATARLPAEWKGLKITAAVGRTYDEALANHIALKERMEVEGTRAKRGERPPFAEGWAPKAPAAWARGAEKPSLFPEAHEVVGRIEQQNHQVLDAAYRKMPVERAFAEAYRDPMTGVLGHIGMGVLHKSREQILSIDVDGLKVSDAFRRELGDEVVRRTGLVMAQVQRQMGESVAAAHPHGDEYGAAHKSADRLQEFAEAVKRQLAKEEVKYVDLEKGITYVQQGIGLSYGIGKTQEIAEEGLAHDKARRVEIGERDIKGKTDLAGKRLRSYDSTPEELWLARVSQDRGLEQPRISPVARGAQALGQAADRIMEGSRQPTQFAQRLEEKSAKPAMPPVARGAQALGQAADRIMEGARQPTQYAQRLDEEEKNRRRALESAERAEREVIFAKQALDEAERVLAKNRNALEGMENDYRQSQALEKGWRWEHGVRAKLHDAHVKRDGVLAGLEEAVARARKEIEPVRELVKMNEDDALRWSGSWERAKRAFTPDMAQQLQQHREQERAKRQQQSQDRAQDRRREPVAKGRGLQR